MNLIITSEHRVGSRWMHYLLADIYSMSPSPEMDAKKIPSNLDEIEKRFKERRIVKFHHALPEDIFGVIPGDYKVIGMVRNPRDRAVSFAFHNRYHKNDYPFPQRDFTTDFEAVQYTVFQDEAYKENTKRQFLLMVPELSTRKFKDWDIENGESRYIWTAYEWMKEDTLEEIRTIVKFIGEDVDDTHVVNTVRKHSFKAKSGRSPGNEDRKNIWRRKGVVGDYLNWFDEGMMYITEEDYATYQEKLSG